MSIALLAENHRIVPLPRAERGTRLIELRQALAEKFPARPVPKTGIVPTGIEAIDGAEGGLRLGAMTEIAGTVAGNSLLLASLLSMLNSEKHLGALIDCGGFFDPGSFQPAVLKRLLWVRCALPADTVKAADLLLRDGNLSLLMLDLQGAKLRGVPASTWHRFQRVVEQGNMALAVFTSRPLVEGASVKISVAWQWEFQELLSRRTKLIASLAVRISSRRNLFASEPAELRIA